MLIERILEEADPLLRGRTISDGILGLAMIAVELDQQELGLAYMLRDQLPPGCSSFAFGQKIIGMPAQEAAHMLLEGESDAERGFAMAVLNAAICAQDLPDEDPKHPTFGVDLQDDDVVAMVGHIPPVAQRIQGLAHKLYVFDEGLSRYHGNKHPNILPSCQQADLLPRCDVVVITGSSLINHTLEELLSLCTKARDVILVGASTPMLPRAFAGTKVTTLAGSCWKSVDKELLFKRIALSGGFGAMKDGMVKKLVRV